MPTIGRATSCEITIRSPGVWSGAMKSWPPSSVNCTPFDCSRDASAPTSFVEKPAANRPSPHWFRYACTGPTPVGSSSSNSLVPAWTTRRFAPSTRTSSSFTSFASKMSMNVCAAASRSRDGDLHPVDVFQHGGPPARLCRDA